MRNKNFHHLIKTPILVRNKLYYYSYIVCVLCVGESPGSVRGENFYCSNYTMFVFFVSCSGESSGGVRGGGQTGATGQSHLYREVGGYS